MLLDIIKNIIVYNAIGYNIYIAQNNICISGTILGILHIDISGTIDYTIISSREQNSEK